MGDVPATLRILAGGLWHRSARPLRGAIVLSGALFALLLTLACTRVPYDLHRWLGMADEECHDTAEAIVVLGGSGMPSGPELLRLQKAAELARAWPGAQVVIVHPGDPKVLGAMAEELLLRGVDERRINRLNAGENTREQALLVAQRWRTAPGGVALVTAPENMRRSVMAFRKAGLAMACPAAAWDHAMDHGFLYAHERLGGKAWLPDVSGRTGLRYTFWNYLKLEVACAREGVALAYYRLNGWI
jgi:uncharacterized SAM-binding protein YcdF (DUF218 family)